VKPTQIISRENSLAPHPANGIYALGTSEG